ncbi:calcium-binding protein [Mesorhizobium sp. CGMCC 1.15528]|uniref:Calcium-binding protein n=1 Tax=Mesorhizobium zhangyense TaxID=1776730 RepID=A0A7C9R9G6_9HYPH|nr:calcium-binding protein [Mesorhizobium zhangyense]NGN43480.1 calcium-binding protein [Mesorhizobium zhangyense]
MTKITVTAREGQDSNLRAQLQEYIDWEGPITSYRSATTLSMHKGGEEANGVDAGWAGYGFEYLSANENDPIPVAGTATAFYVSRTLDKAPIIRFIESSVSLVDSYNALSTSIDAFLDLLGDIEFVGASGSDVVQLGSGNDTLQGYGGHDTFYGMGGNDTLWGAGGDMLYGGTGDDVYIVHLGDRTIELAGEGYDAVHSYVSWTLSDDVEKLVLVDRALNGTGNALDNMLVGNSWNNTLDGKAGNDTYVVSTGDRTIELAGEGTDTVRSDVDWILAANIERLELLGTADLTGNGNTLNNTLVGNDGKNILRGGAGNDTLNGGKGSDTLVGGAGNDTFVFNKPLGSTNIDKINDYNPAQDTIQLDTKYFAGLVTGWLAAGAFHTGTGAHDATDRIIYNATTGDLLFDKDGLGGVAAMKFATLSPGLAMTANDFFVV